MHSNKQTSYSVFWGGRTAYMKRHALSALVKIHTIVDGLVTFTVLLHDEKAGTLTVAEREFYEPGQTITTTVEGMRIRTLNDNQRELLDKLTMVVKVGKDYAGQSLKTT